MAKALDDRASATEPDVMPLRVIQVILLVRTALEDKTRHAELPGYQAYAENVRYQWLPGIW